MITKMPENFAQRLLDNTLDRAALVLNDEDKIQELLNALKGKHPVSNEILSDLISLLDAYANKQYRNISFDSMKIATGALIYYVAGQDYIPDKDTECGFVDDQAVFEVCYKRIQSDLDVFKIWKSNGSFK